MKLRIEQIKNDKIFKDKSLLASSVLQSIAESVKSNGMEELPYDFEEFEQDALQDN